MHVDIADKLAHKILSYFQSNARALAWRNPPAQPLPLDDPDWPYRVWLSEIMLQQTTVATATPYFKTFVGRWPSFAALAAAQSDDVMAAWAGLGYYARARNMLRCAKIVCEQFDGQIPQDETTLRSLPGIGSYTAAAITAFAFGNRAIVVDANIERLVARIFAETSRKNIRSLTDKITPQFQSADFPQAMMDIGAQICRPKSPLCPACPVSLECLGKQTPEAFPAKQKRTPRPERQGVAWWIERGSFVFLVTRPPKGLLGGMRSLPSSQWSATPEFHPPIEGDWQDCGAITHVFSHFQLSLRVMALRVEKGCNLDVVGEWWPITELKQAGLPTVFAKAGQLAATKKG